MSRTKVSNSSLEFLDSNLYSQVLDKVYSCVDFQKTRYQLVNNRVYLDEIKSSPHHITPHFQGYNFLFGFIKLNGIKYNVLVFKNLKYRKEQNNFQDIKIYKFEVCTNAGCNLENLYSGTFFDGKLIASGNRSTYLIHDVYILNGSSTCNLVLTDKLNKISDILDRFYIHGSHYFDCKVCRLYSFDQLPDLVFNKIKQTDLKINGLMFLPDLTGKYYIYTNESEFEELKAKSGQVISVAKKSSSASEVEFYMKKTSTPDVYELYEPEGSTTNLVKEGIAHIPNMSTSHFFRNVFKDKNMVKVNCIRSEKFNKWIPICDEYISYSDSIF
jgi:hypothetical protein